MNEQVSEKRTFRHKVKDLLQPSILSDFGLDNGRLNLAIPMSPWRLLVVLTITVFIVELAIMVGIELVVSPEMSIALSITEAVFDATLLTIIVFPVLYRYSFRPLVLYLTDHQRIEKELKASNDLLENTFASLSDVVLVVDMPERRVITCNPAVPHVLGYDVDELMETPAVNLFDGVEEYQRFVQKMTGAFVDGRYAFHEEWPLRHKDGSILTAEITVTEIKNENGRTTSQVIVIRNITRRKQAEEQLARQNQELKTLSQLGQTVVSSLSLNTIFDHVISQVMPLLKAECFSILLRQEDQLICVANGGIDSAAIINQTMSIHDEIYGQIIRSAEPTLITAPADPVDPVSQELSRVCYCGPQTLMAVPLRVENQIIGVIQAAHRQTNVFTDEGLRLLQAAADWAAIAISHARQHEEIQRRLKETATLAAINQSLNETLDLDNLLQLIADSTPKLLHGAERVVIHLLKREENLLYPAIWSGQPNLDSPALYMSADEGIAGNALKTGTLINVPNVLKDSRFKSFGVENQFKSLMVAPLQSGRTQLGTISVHNVHKENAFSATDEQLLMRLADSAAIAIATANLYQAERTQRQFAETLVQASAALSVSLRLNEIVQTVLDQTLRIVSRCEKAAIYLLQDGKVYLTRSTDDQVLPPRLPDVLHRIFMRQEAGNLPPSQLVAATGKPILIVENNDEPNWPNEEGADWLKSFVAAPLRIRDEIIGFLNVHSTRPGVFDRETIRQVEALAAHASLAIQNARLFNELKSVLQTEQATRAQLVQAQKLSAMGRMVASVAHELNNPLQTIKNCLFLTQYDVPEGAEGNAYIEMALSETKRLSNLVMQLREVYRPGGSGSKKLVSLPQLVNEVYAVLQPHLKEHHVVWQNLSWSNDLVVMADANQIKQVLLNIGLNAIEAMQPDGGSITVDMFVDAETSEAAVSIQDDGPGIPADELSHLFEPFFTTKETGTGLGLAICYDIIQSHGGRIDVKSMVSQGAKFTIWLPSVVTDVVAIQDV
ncbi:MAG: GAF domain-containing protein [Ardenticatenaceae bacterium]|nr:GAF domain-containing protein [Ardenticatenaceae bacterium]MCB9443867.1 GAF domain-containing protein [Ardenticatenaceae bacterium]